MLPDTARPATAMPFGVRATKSLPDAMIYLNEAERLNAKDPAAIQVAYARPGTPGASHMTATPTPWWRPGRSTRSSTWVWNPMTICRWLDSSKRPAG